ncbi:MAG: hypothetical protein AAGH64_01125 [Planctomycetota bacterium]
MAYTPKPHISHALQHLRTGVFIASGVLIVALLAQLASWTVIHFGGENPTRIEAEPGVGQSAVVFAPERQEPSDAVTQTSPGETDGPPSSSADINAVATGTDLVIRRVADVSRVVGIVAVVALLVFLTQSVAVAGGGGVPGVEMVVTASTWAFVLFALAVPWGDVLPEVTFSGVLRSGAGFAESARAFHNSEVGAAGYYAFRVLLPFLMMGGAFACALRFRAGVAKGVIVTHASMLDEQLEAELRKRKLGEGMTPRSVGALNTAIGEAPVEKGPAPMSPPKPAAGPSPMSSHYAPGETPPGRPI